MSNVHYKAYPVNQKKKKKKKWKDKRSRRKEKKKWRRATYGWSPMCKCTWVFHPLTSSIFSLQLSPHFGEKTFWWAQRENIWIPLFIFLLPHSTKCTLQKSFPSTLFHLQTNTPWVLGFSHGNLTHLTQLDRKVCR